MKHFRLLFFCCAALLLLPFAAAEAVSAEDAAVHTISVQGNGAWSAAPDQASIAIGVTSYASTAVEAQQQNAAVAAAIQAKVKEFGINSNNIQTTGYTFYPVYSSQKNRTNEITGYTVNNTISVRVDDVKMVGTIIDASIACGANKINSIDFSVKSTEAIRENALQAAVKDARGKADTLAAAAGKQVVNVLSISETGTYIQNHRLSNIALAKDSLVAETPIEAGDINVSASVEIVFLME